MLMISLNVELFIAQVSINGICDTCNLNYFDFSGSGMADYNAGAGTGNYTIKDFSAADLPQTQVSVSDSGNYFTDLWSTVKNWLIDSIPGARYVVGMVNAIPNFFKSVVPGDAAPIAFALGYMWQAATVFLIIMWLKGN